MSTHKKTLVLGLGNTLPADDGVGVHAVRRLTADAATPPWVRTVDGDTAGFRLTSILTDAQDVLMIDKAVGPACAMVKKTLIEWREEP